jgi:hypothetical protein
LSVTRAGGDASDARRLGSRWGRHSCLSRAAVRRHASADAALSRSGKNASGRVSFRTPSYTSRRGWRPEGHPTEKPVRCRSGPGKDARALRSAGKNVFPTRAPGRRSIRRRVGFSPPARSAAHRMSWSGAVRWAEAHPTRQERSPRPAAGEAIPRGCGRRGPTRARRRYQASPGRAPARLPFHRPAPAHPAPSCPTST